ncbi:MAG: ferritin-like domain-containing protein [Vitreimonas sp.]
MTEPRAASRRNLILGAGKAFTGVTAAALLGGCVHGAMAQGSTTSAADPAQDVQILNAAIALEHEGIAAYTIAAGSGLLQPAVVQVGVIFRGHHEGHRDALIGAVRTLGGTPVAAKSTDEYVRDLDVASLRNQTDVLRLALRLERGAANAYLSLIPSMSADYHQVAARLAGDEAFHAAILANALGEPIPTTPLMFGA